MSNWNGTENAKPMQHLHRIDEDAMQPATAARAPEIATPPAQGRNTDFNWRVVAVQALALLMVVNGALAFYAYRQIRDVRLEMQRNLWRSEQRFQSLDAQVRFDSKRRHLLLGIRDELLRIRPELGLDSAYKYASLALDTAEKYPTVDPLLLVSVGIVESRFDTHATSHAGARGLYQIHPTTGRLLGKSLGWDYSDELLHDPVRNTEMAGLYLEMLMSAYKDVKLVLAEYNGGPMNAGYFRAGASKLAAETKAYVPKVLGVYERLSGELRVAQTAATRDGLTARSGYEPTVGLAATENYSSLPSTGGE